MLTSFLENNQDLYHKAMTAQIQHSGQFHEAGINKHGHFDYFLPDPVPISDQ